VLENIMTVLSSGHITTFVHGFIIFALLLPPSEHSLMQTAQNSHSYFMHFISAFLYNSNNNRCTSLPGYLHCPQFSVAPHFSIRIY